LLSTCADGSPRRRGEDDTLVDVVDVDAYTPLLTEEEVQMPLKPLEHEEAIKAEETKA